MSKGQLPHAHHAWLVTPGSDSPKLMNNLIECLIRVWGCLQDDGLSLQDMGEILDHFPDQPLDFYGAMRASIYDNQIRDWIENEVIDEKLSDQGANLTELCRRLLDK